MLDTKSFLNILTKINLNKLGKKKLLKKPLIKKKINGSKNSSGWNNSGKIVSYHKGGGHKQNNRKIDFYRVIDSSGIITSIEYDPNRTAHIASVYDFLLKSYFYILASKNLRIGDVVKSGLNAEIKLGHSLPIYKIPIGSYIFNISPKVKTPGQISWSAGTFSYVIEKTLKYAKIKISSGKQKSFSINCHATLGIVSNELHFLSETGKAGRSRWLNRRPKVRGVAMNPVDHPHGGGEGKKSGRLLTPWGKPRKN